MLHLILVRHGETEWNKQHRYQGHTDIPLSAFGRRQSDSIAGRLADLEIDAVYASDLQRAHETACIIAERHGLDVSVEPRLREMKFGVLEGLTFDEAQTQYPDMITAWLDDFNQPPTGAETMDAFHARIVSLLDELKQKHDEQTLLLVGHGGSLSEILRVALGLSGEKHWYFELEHTSISEVLISQEYVSLKRSNDTGHLSTLIRDLNQIATDVSCFLTSAPGWRG